MPFLLGNVYGAHCMPPARDHRRWYETLLPIGKCQNDCNLLPQAPLWLFTGFGKTVDFLNVIILSAMIPGWILFVCLTQRQMPGNRVMVRRVFFFVFGRRKGGQSTHTYTHRHTDREREHGRGFRSVEHARVAREDFPCMMQTRGHGCRWGDFSPVV